MLNAGLTWLVLKGLQWTDYQPASFVVTLTTLLVSRIIKDYLQHFVSVLQLQAMAVAANMSKDINHVARCCQEKE